MKISLYPQARIVRPEIICRRCNKVVTRIPDSAKPRAHKCPHGQQCGARPCASCQGREERSTP